MAGLIDMDDPLAAAIERECDSLLFDAYETSMTLLDPELLSCLMPDQRQQGPAMYTDPNE